MTTARVAGMPAPVRRGRRWWPKGICVLLLVLGIGYAVIHIHPHPCFPHVLCRGTVALHSRVPLPPNAAEILRDVEQRLARSPLYRRDRVYDVFLCDSASLYNFFAFPHRGTGGETFFWLGNSCFIRPARFEENRLIGPSGQDVPGERSLAYFLAHELVHAMTADAVGTWRYLRLDRWKQDGYADYVAKAGAFDFAGTLRGFRAHDADLDPQRSGLYLRYHLLVAYLLDQRGISVSELLAGRHSADRIETELRAGPGAAP